MPAPFADVLEVACAFREGGVVMLAEETGQRVGDAREAPAEIKYRRAAAVARGAVVTGDSRVINLVT